MNSQRNQLLEISRKAMKNAYSKYSKLKVGSALLAQNKKGDIRIFSGCNVENVSYGLTICAERVAAFKAISEGYGKFKAISISVSKKGMKIYPCGACRQVLLEFNPKLPLYIDNDSKKYNLSKLMPNSFAKF